MKSYRYFRPTGSSIMQNHMLRRAMVLGSTSASGTWVHYWWRSHWRPLAATTCGTRSLYAAGTRSTQAPDGSTMWSSTLDSLKLLPPYWRIWS